MRARIKWILQNIVQNQALQGTAKIIEMKDFAKLVKVREMYNIWKRLLATGDWLRYEVRTG